ncbi:MAG: glycosyltransferase family 2 protein [bacterium]
MPSPRFTLIIPCYNEEKAILKTIHSLRSTLQSAQPYELIVVDDGSMDGSSEILREETEKDPELHIITHKTNRGYGAALKSGIRHASSDIIVITDADGTYPNVRIKELVEIAQNTDMVVGARTSENVTYPLTRKISKLFLERYVSWLAGQEVPDMNSGLRVFKRSISERFLNILPDGFSFTTTITLAMIRNNYEVEFVPIDYYPRIGKSKIRPVRDTLRFMELILRTGIYFAPLRVFLPLVLLLSISFLGSLSYDIILLNNLTDKTLILLMFTLNTALFALLADMIDKRSG